MKNRPLKIVAGLIILGVCGVAGWYLVSPLFIDQVVQEDFPFEIPSPEKLAQMSAEELKQMEAEVMKVAAQMPGKVMQEPMPEVPHDVQPTTVAQGQLQDADAVHRGSGSVTIYRLAEGRHILRLENINVTNGPALHVLLASHPAPSSRAEVKQGYVDLGSLKGNIGSQNYDIPAATDISQFKSVVIYCMPFHVIFSTASLNWKV